MESSSQPPFSISRDTEFDDRNHQLSLLEKSCLALKLYSENFFVVHKAFHKKRCKIIAVIMTIKCIPHLDYYYSYFTLTLHCKKLAHKVNFKQINFALARSKDCRMKIPRPKLLNHATFHASVIIESFV